MIDEMEKRKKGKKSNSVGSSGKKEVIGEEGKEELEKSDKL
jgi:hypothetical protein